MNVPITVWLGSGSDEIRLGSAEQERRLIELGQSAQAQCPHPCDAGACTCCIRLVRLLTFLARWARERQATVDQCQIAVSPGRQDITVSVHDNPFDESLQDALADLERALAKHIPQMRCAVAKAVRSGTTLPIDPERTIIICATPYPTARPRTHAGALV